MEAILFPKGQNKCFLVFGSVFFGKIELKVNCAFDLEEEAISYHSMIMEMFPNNVDIGIQEHIVNKVNVSLS